MDLQTAKQLFEGEIGAVIIALDSETKPSPGFRKVVEDEVALVFNDYGASGYEQLVRQQLATIGKNPDDFVCGDLPFGKRIDQSPFIEHKGKHYIQTVTIKEGRATTFVGMSPCEPTEFPDVFMRGHARRDASYRQGLPPAEAVLVRTYALENIKAIRLQHKKAA